MVWYKKNTLTVMMFFLCDKAQASPFSVTLMQKDKAPLALQQAGLYFVWTRYKGFAGHL
jgi:hypothetical protein